MKRVEAHSVAVLSDASSRRVFKALCRIGVPGVHQESSCLACGTASGPDCAIVSPRLPSSFARQAAHAPAAHLELRALYALAKACASQARRATPPSPLPTAPSPAMRRQESVQIDCRAAPWVGRVRAALALLASGPALALAGLPYTRLRSAFAEAEWCTTPLVLVEHSPRQLAEAQLRSRGAEPLCAAAAAADDPLDLLVCAARCAARRGRLSHCLRTAAGVGLAGLTRAYERSREEARRTLGPRALRLNASLVAAAAADGALRGRLAGFLRSHRASGRRCVASRCAHRVVRPRAAEGAPPAGLPFFVHEFEVCTRTSQFFRLLRQRATDLDAALPVSSSQYLTDVFLLDALRLHPSRVHSPAAARLHVLAIPAHASYARSLALLGETAQRKHRSRMAAVAQRVRLIVQSLPADAPLLVVMGFFHPQVVFGPALLDVLQASNTILCTSDPDFAAHAYLNERALVIPYRVTSALEQTSFTAPQGDWSPRFSFMFHGDLSRADGGLRRTVRDALYLFHKASGRPISVQDVPLTKLSDKASRSHRENDSDEALLRSSLHRGAGSTAIGAALQRTSTEMQKATFCIVPVGDTLTSRRLFEALAAGCVPVVIRQAAQLLPLHLPFPHVIPWDQIAVFMVVPQAAGPECASEGLRLLWQNATSAEGRGSFERMRERGRLAFKRHLALQLNSSGVADAMLRELQARGQVKARSVRDRLRLNGAVASPAERIFVLRKHRLLICASPRNSWHTAMTAHLVAFISGTDDDPHALSTMNGSESIASIAVNPAWHLAALVEGPHGAPQGPLMCGGLAVLSFDTHTTFQEQNDPHDVAAAVLESALIATGVSAQFATWAVGISQAELVTQVAARDVPPYALPTAFDIYRQMYIRACLMNGWSTASGVAGSQQTLIQGGWPMCRAPSQRAPVRSSKGHSHAHG